MINESTMNKEYYYLLIVGSRMSKTYDSYEEFKECVDHILEEPRKQDKQIVIVHGCCKSGGDLLAEYYALDNEYDIIRMPAKWSKYGKRAGYIRNVEMHKYISSKPHRQVFAWWDGVSRGTAHSFELSKAYRNPIIVYNFIEHEEVRV